MNIERLSDDFFIPGRFAGKNVIVTGSARGMGEVAVRRLAREWAINNAGPMNALRPDEPIDYPNQRDRPQARLDQIGTTLPPMVERAFKIISQRRAEPDVVDAGISLSYSSSLLELSDQNSKGSTSAEQVAIMLFLLSPEASNITGSTYNTDGGYTIF